MHCMFYKHKATAKVKVQSLTYIIKGRFNGSHRKVSISTNPTAFWRANHELFSRLYRKCFVCTHAHIVHACIVVTAMLSKCILEWQCQFKTDSLYFKIWAPRASCRCLPFNIEKMAAASVTVFEENKMLCQRRLLRVSDVELWIHCFCQCYTRSFVNIGDVWVRRWMSSLGFYSSKCRGNPSWRGSRLSSFSSRGVWEALFSLIYAVLRTQRTRTCHFLHIKYIKKTAHPPARKILSDVSQNRNFFRCGLT